MTSSPPDGLTLSELQSEALREVFNMGAGQAASSLAALTGQHILLRVSALNVMDLEDVPSLGVPQDTDTRTVMLHIDGDLTGFTSIIFNTDSARRFLEMSAVVVDSEAEYEVLADSAMSELGNIVLSAVLSKLADAFSFRLAYSTPTLLTGTVEQLVATGALGRISQAIVARILFSVAEENTEGHMLVVLDLSSMRLMLPRIDGYLQEHGLV